MMQKNEPLFIHHQSAPLLCAAWSPDGQVIALGDRDGFIQLWDAKTGRRLLTYGTLNYRISALAWSPRGDKIASGDMLGRIAIWEAMTGYRIFLSQPPRITSEEGDYSAYVAWSPDGRQVASSGYQRNGDMMISLWDARTGERLTRWSCTKYISELQWSPTGAYIAGGDSLQTVHLWISGLDVAGQEVATYHRSDVNGPGYVTSIAWSEEGNQLAFGDTLGIVQVWDVTENLMLSTYVQEAISLQPISSWNPKPIHGLAWMPGGANIASAYRSVQIREAATGRCVATYPDPFEGDREYVIHRVDWSPDRHRVISVGTWLSRDKGEREGCLYMWEVGEEISEGYQELTR